MNKNRIIYLSAFLAAFGVSTLTLGMIFFIQEKFSATPSQVGLFAASWQAAYIAGCFFFRKKIDNLFPGLFLFIAALIMIITTVLMFYAPAITTEYFLNASQGLAFSFFWPVIMGWMSRGAEGHTLSKNLSFYNISWSLGLIIAPSATGFLSARRPEYAIGAAVISYTLLGFICLFSLIFLKERNSGQNHTQTQCNIDNQENKKKDFFTKEGVPYPDNAGLKYKYLRTASWIGLFAAFCAMGIVVNVFPVIFERDFRLSRIVIGNILLVRSGFMTITFLLLSRLVFWHENKTAIISGQIILGLTFALFLFFKSPALLTVMMACFGVLLAFSYSNSIFHGTAFSLHRAYRMAIHEVILSFGNIAGSAAGGYIYEHYSRIHTILLCAGIILTAALIQSVVLHAGHSHTRTGGA